MSLHRKPGHGRPHIPGLHPRPTHAPRPYNAPLNPGLGPFGPPRGPNPHIRPPHPKSIRHR